MKKAQEALKEKRQKQVKADENRAKALDETKTAKLREKNKQLKKRIEELEDENDRLTELNDELNCLIDEFFDDEPNKNDFIIYDIFRVYSEKSSNYSEDLIKMCTELIDISEPAYKALLKYIPVLPGIDYIKNLRKDKFFDFSESLLDLKKLPEMLIRYKTDNNIIGQDKLYCALAVDALYFRPDIKINQKGVQGFSKDIEIKKTDFNRFSHDIDHFMSFVKSNWKDIIRSGFVYQINPLHVRYKPIVVFIYPSTNGKANNLIIQKLY